MLLRFDLEEFNYITGDSADYFLLRTGSQTLMAPDRCPHRGGPLHQAQREGQALVCPWHEARVPLNALRRRSLALIRRGSQVAVILDEPSAGAPRLMRRSLIADADLHGPRRSSPCPRSLNREIPHDEARSPRGCR
ncbi:Rieske 2Fe-2S domain-containing protein [Sorangium sp. So ce726]|uniref:Rieske 2Fe-2S domain-containing protein n=1 Tax=Sorangium sp. So ce726 TaxID=3133319 RepID=UPI003F60ED0C